MVSYSSSEATKTALIMAAGELFAEHGIDAVTTRAIADKAGENIGIIHYHFGGKEGLIEAVVDYASECCVGNPFKEVIEDHRSILSTSNGQNAVIAKLVEIFFEKVFEADKPSWTRTLIFQIIQRDLDISRKTMDKVALPSMNAFMEIYRIVSGDSDIERAYIWGMSIMAPAIISAVNPHEFSRICQGREPSDKFILKLRSSCVHRALSSAEFLRKRSRRQQNTTKV